MPGAEPPQAWRLGGIIGRDADYLAWLAYANGKWQPRRPAALLDAHWRLLKVEARSITVEALQGCGPLRKIILQGNRYDQDDLSADTARPQAALRHHGAAVADVR
ncbi:hypothetical protein ACQK5W_01405 [Pantoea sp. FN060301]|uniref:hypothetical protein n=1 Tax=Pantoea sp. FN060301 TaxID=3420380 RepID=UPI003D16C452